MKLESALKVEISNFKLEIWNKVNWADKHGKCAEHMLLHDHGIKWDQLQKENEYSATGSKWVCVSVSLCVCVLVLYSSFRCDHERVGEKSLRPGGLR